MTTHVGKSDREVACRRAGLAIAVAAALLAPQMHLCCVVHGQDTVIRSFATDRSGPSFNETQTANGWELRSPTYTVFGEDREEAHRAAAEFGRAWQESERLAAPWNNSQRRPQFARAAVQVYLASQPPDDVVPATLKFDGDVAIVYLDASPENGGLGPQLPLLRLASAASFWRVAEVDRALPSWVCDGLSLYVADQLAREDQIDSATAHTPTQAVAGEFTRPKRGVAIQPPPTEGEYPAGLAVRYLLESDDARHAPEFFQALRQTISNRHLRDSEEVSLGELRRRQFSPNGNSPVDRLLVDNTNGFRQWQDNPLAGQPIFEPDPNTPPPVVSQQRDMTVVLKLARRFGVGRAARIETRISNLNLDDPNTLKANEARARPADINELYRRLTSTGAQPWATIDAHGKLLLSTDTEQLQRLFGAGGQRYAAELREERLVISTRSNSGRIDAWLEENENDAQRPLARFELAGSTGGVRIDSLRDKRQD